MTKYAVFGSGMVGQELGAKLVSLGHEVWMGSRTADNEAGAGFVKEAGAPLAHQATFADACGAAEIAILAVKGDIAMVVLDSIGSALDGKILIDLTNPLDFSKGFPPTLFHCNDDSLGERVQKKLPNVKVVKTLNTCTASIMVDPGKLSEPTDLFISGNDADAKATVVKLLKAFGHSDPIDLGDISQARGQEAWLLLWTRLYGVLGTGEFNLKLVRTANAKAST